MPFYFYLIKYFLPFCTISKPSAYKRAICPQLHWGYFGFNSPYDPKCSTMAYHHLDPLQHKQRYLSICQLYKDRRHQLCVFQLEIVCITACISKGEGNIAYLLPRFLPQKVIQILQQDIQGTNVSSVLDNFFLEWLLL